MAALKKAIRSNEQSRSLSIHCPILKATVFQSSCTLDFMHLSFNLEATSLEAMNLTMVSTFFVDATDMHLRYPSGVWSWEMVPSCSIPSFWLTTILLWTSNTTLSFSIVCHCQNYWKVSAWKSIGSLGSCSNKRCRWVRSIHVNLFRDMPSMRLRHFELFKYILPGMLIKKPLSRPFFEIMESSFCLFFDKEEGPV